jgi:16S rRNA G966 N2-methylase RsmD
VPDVEATWFIDPPYQYGGEHYMINSIDYNRLAEFCQSRKGQIIVCENTKAGWLPFKPLISTYGQSHDSKEAIWLNGKNDVLTVFC